MLGDGPTLRLSLMLKANEVQITFIDSPLIAYPMLFENKYSKFHSKPFSTLSAAVSWIRE